MRMKVTSTTCPPRVVQTHIHHSPPPPRERAVEREGEGGGEGGREGGGGGGGRTNLRAGYDITIEVFSSTVLQRVSSGVQQAI